MLLAIFLISLVTVLDSYNFRNKYEDPTELKRQYTVCENENGQWYYFRNREGHDHNCYKPLATADYVNDINQTGWAFVEVEAKSDIPLWEQGYAAGFAEGRASRHLISFHVQNMVDGYCKGAKKYCKKLFNYLEYNYEWMLDRTSPDYQRNENRDYWNEVNLTLNHVKGMMDGYDGLMHQQLSTHDLVRHPVYMLQFFGDLMDLEVKFDKPETSPVPKGRSHCSALVRRGNDDILFSHVTWVSYSSMLRMQKKYTFGTSKKRTSYSFSGYPGTVSSIDDFVLTSSKLAILETTIENHNKKLYSYARAQSLPSFIRSQISHRSSTTGLEWAKTFSKYNSGTYNNQWVILDYKVFKKEGSGPLLYVLEQMPGRIVHADQTSFLDYPKKGWPSYNRAFYPEIFNKSGSPEMVEKFGDWYSYDKCPRAQIFKRDAPYYGYDIPTMTKLMRSNNFTTDEYSRCNCTPPYSAESVIAARSELNDPYGIYPIKDLGFMDQGATDVKITNSSMIDSLTFSAISGPTYNPTPVFDWRTSILRDTVPHHGHPNRWTFPQIVHQWRNRSVFD